MQQNPSISANASKREIEADLCVRMPFCVAIKEGFLIPARMPAPKKPPRLVEGDRPYVLFYAQDLEKGGRRRIRIYCPENERKGYTFSRWKKRTIGTVGTLLEKGYAFSRSAPGPIPLVSPDGIPAGMESNIRRTEVPPGLIAALRWAEAKKALVVRPRTLECYRSAINRLEAWDGNTRRTDQMTKADVAEFSDYLMQSVSATTRNNIFSVLRTLFTRILEGNGARSNPFSGVKPLRRNTRKSNRAFTSDQATLLLDWAIANDPGLYFLVRMIYWSFARPVELERLRLDDVDPEKGIIYFRGEITKNGRDAVIHLPAPARQLLKDYMARHANKPRRFHLVGPRGIPSAGQTGETTYNRRHRIALEAVGLEGIGLNLYSWKHTGVCAAFDAGMSVMEIRDRCRHKSVQQTEEYLRDLRRVSTVKSPYTW